MNQTDEKSTPTRQPRNILLVEDDPDHAELTMMALRDSQMLDIITCSDAEEALEYLYHTGKEVQGGDDAPRPNLILLDLKLPGKNGIEMLRIIKGDSELASIPVCMLTTSENIDDIDQCYAAGANSYVSKPVRFPEFQRKIRSISRFWLSVNEAPFPSEVAIP